MANGVRALEISNPIPGDGSTGSDSVHVSLLPKPDDKNGLGHTVNPSSSVSTDGSAVNLQNSFFGQFKGFSITPLPSNSSSPSKLPSTPSRSPPAPSTLTTSVSSVHVQPPISSNSQAQGNSTADSTGLTNTTLSSAISSANVTATFIAPASLPSSQPSATARPFISSPILDATTCTAKELISSTPPIPSRPAPEVPMSSVETSAYTPLTGSSSKSVRPLSSPNSLSIDGLTSQPLEDKKIKDSGSSYPTLTRLASFMMRQSSGAVSRSQSQNQGSGQPNEKVKGKDKSKAVAGGSNSLPRTHHYGIKANKLQIHKEALRNLQISNPIPQQDIDIPQKVVPVRPAPSLPPSNDSSKQVVMRAQSLRDKGPVTQRPSIPTFGSMRHASGTKRPTSIPAGARPTSPPPPRPPPPPTKPVEQATGIIGLPGYQNPPTVSPKDYCYDDCFNLLSDGNAPLANIDEESSPNSGDNIYAVIEESPPGSGRKKIGQNFSPSSEYAAPVPPKSSASSDNQGVNSKFEYTSPSFNEYKSPKPVENSISAGSLESVGLLSEIVNEIQARNMESIYSTSTLGRKKNNKGDGSDMDDTLSTITATDSSIAGSASPQLSRAVATSSSSLGTYVNASIYRPGGSVYSNLSTQTNPASSPQLPSVKSCSSSSSSSSGYLSPTPPTTAQSSVVNSTSNISINKDFSTFKSPLQTANMTTTFRSDIATTSVSKPAPVDIKKNQSVASPPTTTLPQNVSTYKPYSSTLQRSLGPLAASFRGGSSSPMSSTVKDSKTDSLSTETSKQVTDQNPVPAVANKNSVTKVSAGSPLPTTSPKVPRNKSSSSVTTKASSSLSSSQAPSFQPSQSSLHRTPTPPSLSMKSSVSCDSGSQKPVSNTPEVSLTATVSSSALHRGKVLGAGVRSQTPPTSNSPDVVSSCSVGGNGNSGRSPDVVEGGKVDAKGSLKSPDVVAANKTVKPVPYLPTRSTAPSGVHAVNRSASAAGSGTAKSTIGTGNRVSSIHSSFKGGPVVKQPQLAPKPSMSKPGASITTGNISQQEKMKTGAAGVKDMSSKVTGVGRGATVTKSASDVTGSGNKLMPVSAKAAASKHSHVASLQQKFETVAASEKGGTTVGRTPSSAVNKTRPTSTVVGSKATSVELSTGRNAGFRK